MRDEILRSWTFEPWLALSLLSVAVIYLRGSFEWRRRRLRRGCTPARIACYLGGLFAIWIALASPIESFAPLLLSAHMGQHMLLTMVAAPLLLLGEPLLPLIRGLPATVRRHWLGPFMASPDLRRIGGWIVHPVVAWCVFTMTLIAWHVPVLYELALHDPFWHRVEHACLLASAVLLWWPVIQPAPSRAWWPKWAAVPYLLLADIVNTIIAACFAFAPSVIYPTYASTAPALGIDALRDQAAAGALMWVPGSIAYLVPATVILVAVLRPKSLRMPGIARARSPRTVSLVQLDRSRVSASATRRGDNRTDPTRQFDLLRVPIVGGVLRRRWARLALRAAMLLLAAIIVVDGLIGPREAPMNLAGTLPWTHWRGAAVLLLLIGGNFLCMTCPFVLPRMVARSVQKWRHGSIGSASAVVVGTLAGAVPHALRRTLESTTSRRWPRALRNKWTAIVLLVGWLIVYEAFDLWASPLATAWVIVAYFVAAFVVDTVTKGGAFCKWVCPLGQFHFAQSTVSPLTVAVHDHAVCASCTTHDCIRGNATRNGCELELFVPRKVGNLDCTFCLDCVDACPHGNVGVLTQSIGGELRWEVWRSSLGRLSRRPDIAALLLILSVGAIANAAGMTAPVLDLMAQLSAWSGTPRWASAAAVVAATLLLPVVFVLIASFVTARVQSSLKRRSTVPSRGRGDFMRSFTAIAISITPLGAAVWLVHFAFHLVTSWQTATPVMIRAANDMGITTRAPEWASACCANAPEWLLPTNLAVLSLGTSMSLWTLARQCEGGSRFALRLGAWLPGAIVIISLWAAAAWVLFQPMDMRGTMGFEVIP